MVSSDNEGEPIVLMIKRILLPLLLVIEGSVFAYVYLHGNNGVYALQRLCNENRGIEQKIDQLSHQVAQLEHEITEWETNDFYKEKVAREQLQMSRKDDEIYYIV